MDQNTINEGKTMAIISYITLIGLIIAWFMNREKQNEFVKFHIGQSVSVVIAFFAISIISTILVMVTGIASISYLGLAGWIFVVLGAINASGGKVEKLPIIGNIG